MRIKTILARTPWARLGEARRIASSEMSGKGALFRRSGQDAPYLKIQAKRELESARSVALGANLAEVSAGDGAVRPTPPYTVECIEGLSPDGKLEALGEVEVPSHTE
jgi:hypothetical protein